MPEPPITRILVAWAGTMGSQFAMVCALANTDPRGRLWAAGRERVTGGEAADGSGAIGGGRHTTGTAITCIMPLSAL